MVFATSHESLPPRRKVQLCHVLGLTRPTNARRFAVFVVACVRGDVALHHAIAIRIADDGVLGWEVDVIVGHVLATAKLAHGAGANTEELVSCASVEVIGWLARI